jgi:hypothetical protein
VGSDRLGAEDLATLSPKIRLQDEGDLGASISSGSESISMAICDWKPALVNEACSW